MPVLVGKKAPSFTAKAVAGSTIIEDFSLDQFLGKKYVVFFFYPKDFTFVCPTELHRFQEELAEFESREVAVVGCSTDSEFSHWAWLQTPKAKGGIEGVTYPLVADVNKTISDAYDVLAGDYDIDENGTLVVRGETEEVAFQFLLCRFGARLVDARAELASAGAAKEGLVEVRTQLDLGPLLSSVAAPFLPTLSFWFDRAHPGSWVAHRMPLFSKGPTVLVVRSGVSPAELLPDVGAGGL